MNFLFLRGGYKTNYDEEGLSFGFGIQYEILETDLVFDYSHTDFGRFSDVSRFTLSMEF